MRKNKLRIYGKFVILNFGKYGLHYGSPYGLHKVNRQMWTGISK